MERIILENIDKELKDPTFFKIAADNFFRDSINITRVKKDKTMGIMITIAFIIASSLLAFGIIAAVFNFMGDGILVLSVALFFSIMTIASLVEHNRSIHIIRDYKNNPNYMNIGEKYVISDKVLGKSRMLKFLHIQEQISNKDMKEIIENCLIPLSFLTDIINKKRTLSIYAPTREERDKIDKEISDLLKQAEPMYALIDKFIGNKKDLDDEKNIARFNYSLITLYKQKFSKNGEIISKEEGTPFIFNGFLHKKFGINIVKINKE